MILTRPCTLTAHITLRLTVPSCFRDCTRLRLISRLTCDQHCHQISSGSPPFSASPCHKGRPDRRSSPENSLPLSANTTPSISRHWIELLCSSAKYVVAQFGMALPCPNLSLEILLYHVVQHICQLAVADVVQLQTEAYATTVIPTSRVHIRLRKFSGIGQVSMPRQTAQSCGVKEPGPHQVGIVVRPTGVFKEVESCYSLAQTTAHHLLHHQIFSNWAESSRIRPSSPVSPPACQLNRCRGIFPDWGRILGTLENFHLVGQGLCSTRPDNWVVLKRDLQPKDPFITTSLTAWPTNLLIRRSIFRPHSFWTVRSHKVLRDDWLFTSTRAPASPNCHLPSRHESHHECVSMSEVIKKYPDEQLF